MLLVTRRQLIEGVFALVTTPKRRRTELILALDGSGSAFKGELPHWHVQLLGHIYALTQQDIRAQLYADNVYLRIVLWSDYNHPLEQLFGDTVDSPEVCDQAVKALEEQQRRTCGSRYCSLTHHYWLVQEVLRLKPMGERVILDVSTDQAPEPLWKSELDTARLLFQQRGGVINALAVEMSEEDRLLLRTDLCSPSGFCIPVSSAEEYAAGLASKMMQELTA